MVRGVAITPGKHRYAFIDVPNTTGTTTNVLHFSIDWARLYQLLRNEKWSCSKIFFYKGHKGEKEKEQLDKLRDIGYTVRTKLTHIHPDSLTTQELICPWCQGVFVHPYRVKGNRKSNCDVELTVDALEAVQPGDQVLMFTGDGDFAYLIETLLIRGATVTLVSSKNKDSLGNSRFSTRLTSILEREERGKRRVSFIHILNWKHRIEKV
jgi:uncharacterized LabA/DUF88 family protein